jgi:predicted CxxxxCH...CXXCH cytochrome family protein
MKKLFSILLATIGILFSGCSGPKPDRPDEQCGSCHLLPPGDAFHTAHQKYDQCSICHPGYSNVAVNAATHQNGKIDVAFSQLFDPQYMGAYDASTGTCSNVYCHGAFPQGTNASITYPSTIYIGKNCQICHDTASIMLNHHRFTQQNDTVSNCGKCHPGYGSATGAMAGRFVNDSIHINGIIDHL